MKPAVVYIRVSTTRQASEGVSLEAQEARARAWATASGREVHSVHVDAGLSGGRADNRPALRAALDATCEARGALVVYSLSRLARSVSDTLSIAQRLDAAGADLVSLSESIDTTSAAGKMMFPMLAVLAEFERDLVAERTRMSLAYLRAQGRHTGGGVPFGCQVEGETLVPQPEELAAIEAARALRVSGLSLRRVAAALEARGMTSRTGRRFAATQVARLVR